MTPAEIRTALLAQLDAAPPALHELPAGFWRWEEPARPYRVDRNPGLRAAWDAKQAAMLAAFHAQPGHPGYTMFQAGPGTYNVLNTAVHRERFRERLMASAGFKDNGQKYRAPGRRLRTYGRPLTADEIAEAQS